jgi:protein-tyrosine-phosphatase
MTKKRVLFLCTGNSARSQMAEALLRQLAGDHFEAASAGTEPRPAVHPDALATLASHHVAAAELVPKDVSSFAGQRFDYVITVCERARERCPLFPGAELVQWLFPDPADVEPEAARRRAFEDVFQGLSERIRVLASERASLDLAP